MMLHGDVVLEMKSFIIPCLDFFPEDNLPYSSSAVAACKAFAAADFLGRRTA